MGLRKTVTVLDDNGNPITYEPGKIKTGKHRVGPITVLKDLKSVINKKNS